MRHASKDHSTSYTVRYRYRTPQGESLEGDAQVDVYRWEALQEREPLAVTYLASDPRVSRIEGDAPWLGIIFLLFGGVFAGSGGFLVTRELRKIGAQLGLLRYGQRGSATITDIVQTNLRVNGVPRWEIQYQYKDSLGRSYSGSSGPLPPQEADLWQTGDSGVVYYHRRQPEQSVWLGKREGSA